jgi:hypothetical protein
MRRWTLAALLLVLLSGPAAAQVMQTGGVIPQHLSMWSTNNVVQDAGGAARLTQGLQPLELGLVAPPNQSGNPFPATASGTGPNGENSCTYDSPLGQAGHYLCFSPNVGSNTSQISVGTLNGGTPGTFRFLINGTPVTIPGAGSGTVVGPVSSTAGDVSCFNNTSGTIIADCGPTGLVMPLVPTQTNGDNSTKAASTAFVKNQGYLTSSNIIVAPQGRLTLASASTAPGNLGAGLTTIYYANFVGNQVPVWNGTSNTLLPIPSGQISDVIPNTGSGVISATQVFDIFAVNRSGTLAICHVTNGAGLGWAGDAGGSNTGRGSGYTQLQNTTTGFLTNSNALANCYNAAVNFGSIPATQATYLGTGYTTGIGTLTWNLIQGASGGPSGASAVTLGIWNYYNRINLLLNASDTGVAYTYSSATVRQARGAVGNQVVLVIGVAEDFPAPIINAGFLPAALNALMQAGYNVNTSTSFLGRTLEFQAYAANVNSGGGMPLFAGGALVGVQTYIRLEASDGTNANIFNPGQADGISVYTRG